MSFCRTEHFAWNIKDDVDRCQLHFWLLQGSLTDKKYENLSAKFLQDWKILKHSNNIQV